MTEKTTEILIADGIPTRVSVIGRGEPLLMFSPGGFDATLEKWSELGVYKKINIMSYLADRFTCILFDRRECGRLAVDWRRSISLGWPAMGEL